MATPNMATITASLVRSFQNCSLNHQHSGNSSCNNGCGGGEAARGADSPENPLLDSATPTLELNSEAALPYYWEQCLDLKTGEIYYINWRTGMKSKEDPRTTAAYGGDYYSEDDVSSYDSEGSSTESSPPCSSRVQWSGNSKINNQEKCCTEDQKSGNESGDSNNNNTNNCGVLVVAGCKGCFMYYMVPKQNEICPKCCGKLIHFDRSENGYH